MCIPDKEVENRMEPISEHITKPLYRKLDRGSNMVIGNVYNGDIFVTGEDKFLKKIRLPYRTVFKD